MTTTVPASKNELLTTIEGTYAALVRDLQRVPVDRAREASLAAHRAGTMMSPADLVAYLIGWNELVLSWFEQKDRGEEPEFPAPGFRWNQLGKLAERFYADYATVAWDELLGRLAAAKSALVALIEQRTNADLYGSPWYEKYTAGRMIQFNTSSPYRNARGRIRAWLRDNVAA